MGNEIAVLFFDLGDTLGSPILTPPPMHLTGFNVFPFVLPILDDIRRRGLRIGVISNSGDDEGEKINHVLETADLLRYFEKSLLIYSKDVGLTKSSAAIFRLAAERAGLATDPRRCLFVGEDASERASALDAGWSVVSHPLLVSEVLDGQQLQYVRLVVPFRHRAAEWRAELRVMPFVPAHVTGPHGTTVYATTSVRQLSKLMDMGFEVDLLGAPDTPLRTDLYILRDDASLTSGFLANRGQSERFFSRAEDTRLVLRSTGDGLVIALPPERSLEEFHFEHAYHGHNLKLVSDVSLLDPFTDSGAASPAWLRRQVPTFAPLNLAEQEIAELSGITSALMVERVERYGGRRPISPDGDRIESRHIFHPGNAAATSLVAQEFETVGKGRIAVRLHRFTHAGQQLYNVEAELVGTSSELVLVTAHLDSTAAFSTPYDPVHDPAPGMDDDASGMAAVLAIAERFVTMSEREPLVRTVRFVLFNAEEHGLVGSKAYARQQKLLHAPIVAVFQMDMVGYNKLPPRSWEIHAGYSASPEVERRSLQLAAILTSLAGQVSPGLEPPQIYSSSISGGDPAEGRSDHAPFQSCGYAACVASEDFFAGPDSQSPHSEENPNYHKKEDTFIDGDFAADIARVLAAAAWFTAKSSSQTASRATFIAQGGKPMPRELDTRRSQDKLMGKAVAPNITSAPPSIPLNTRTNPITDAPVSIDAPARRGQDQTLVERAMSFVGQQKRNFGFAEGDPAEYVPDPTVQFTSAGAAAVHLQQYYRGLSVFQMARSVRFAPDGQIAGASGDGAQVPPGLDTEPKLSATDAVAKAAEHLAKTAGEEKKDRFGGTYTATGVDVQDFKPELLAGFPLVSRPSVFSKGPFENPIPAYLLVFYHPDGARVAWHVTLTLQNYEDQYVMLVSADQRSGEILYCKSTMQGVVARGNVYEQNPQDTPRKLVDFPRPVADYPVMPSTPLVGFPTDWVSQNEAQGNSTIAVLGTTTTTLRGTINGGLLEFNPADEQGDDQKILNIFYFCNYMHDILYLLGFDEAAGNFQQINFTHTGLGQDPVRARAHSGAVNGVANMGTPPDGLPPLMNMGLYTPTNRHTAFDADVVMHEYTHGLTNRVVGGRVNAHALDAAQSGGMGEGWSDFFALTIQNFLRLPSPEKTATGAWVVNNARGIRSAPYDEHYPRKYGDIANMSDEHDIGEVWCAALMQMARNIRRVLESDRDGYRLSWQIVSDGLKLTHANPSFLDARDAILQALDDLKAASKLPPSTYDQVHRACWEGFARFGMGFRASCIGPNLDGIVSDETLPPDV
ncbi:hypothetical protein AB7M74_001872 [Bradyrhizobium japonicum]